MFIAKEAVSAWDELSTLPKSKDAVSAYEALPSNCPITLVTLKVSVCGT